MELEQYIHYKYDVAWGTLKDLARWLLYKMATREA